VESYFAPTKIYFRTTNLVSEDLINTVYYIDPPNLSHWDFYLIFDFSSVNFL